MSAISGNSTTASVEPVVLWQSSTSAPAEGTFSRRSSTTDHVSFPLRSLSTPAGDNIRRTPPAGRSRLSEGAESEVKARVSLATHTKRSSEADHSSSPQSCRAAKTPWLKKEAHKRLSHLTSTGDMHMVDISHKIPTRRSATATAFVLFSNPHPYAALTDKYLPKGDAIAVARVAGIQAAKKTADFIPLAHPGLGLTGVKVGIELLTPSTGNHEGDSEFNAGEAGFEFGGVKITAQVSCDGKTGVEMEALTAANVAALTMYDMCKAVDKHMLVTGVRVTMKKGGKSGDWKLDGDIPDPRPSPIFEPALRRRMAGMVDEPEHHAPPHVPNQTPELEGEDPSPAPDVTAGFLNNAASELDLFIANTTSPAKAAEIAGQRRRHKALTARIKDLQRKTQQGHDVSTTGEDIRDGRVDYDALERLHSERREIASKVLGWRIGGGSEIKEATETEVNLFQQSKDDFAEKAAGHWRWEAGVYGVWDADKHREEAEHSKKKQ